MDVAPPNPPPIVQAAQQPAIDILKRIDATRHGIDALFDELPSLAEPSVSDAQALQASLASAWSQPDGAGTRTQRLGALLTATMRDFAALRLLDGTLSDSAARVARRACQAAEGTALPQVHLHELILGDAPYAGALAVTDEDEPGTVLLFTPHGGWVPYDSMEHLLTAVRRQELEDAEAFAARGIATDDLADAQAEGFVGVRALDGRADEALAARMVATQARQVALAIDDFVLSHGVDHASVDLADQIRRALRGAFLIDIEAISQQRAAALVEATVMERLAGVPTEVRDAWIDARDAYTAALDASTRVQLAAGLAPPLPLEAFAVRELGSRLRSLGIEADPRDILVDITDSPMPSQPPELIQHMLGQASQRTVALVELAKENISASLPQILHARQLDGTSLAGQLGSGALKGMIRDLDLATRYRAHLTEALRDGAGALARSLAMALDRAWLRFEAQEARLSYYLPDATTALIPDHAERGFRWIEAALDAPVASSRRKIDGHEVTVSQLTYKGTPLADVLIIGVGAPLSVPRIIMYTPGAPDGRSVREFEDRQAAARAFLYHPTFREYLLDRLPSEVSRTLPNGATREFAGDHRAHWVLGAARDAAYTLTEEPFDEAPVSGDFLAARYDTMVGLAIRNAGFTVRSAADADADADADGTRAWISAAGTPLAGSFVASALADIPSNLARAAQASWRMYDQIKAGDMGEAFVAIADAYVNALNIVMPPFVGGRQIAQGIVRSGAGSPRLVTAAARSAVSPARFESRYAVRSIASPGNAGADGIYRLREGRFIRNNGTFYAVHYHADYGTWRLARPGGGHPHPDFTGPAITYVDGHWQFNQEVGLRGGMRRIRERFRQLLRREGEPEQAPLPPAAPVVAEAAQPAGPRWDIALPESIAHLRDEITVALTDNPSAWLAYRADGNHLRFGVPSRSGFILDPHLHPELATLSSHQRRVFLRDLEARLPQLAERNEALLARGWARDGGYRIPSPPGSPGTRPRSPGAGQSTDISSSLDDAAPAPAAGPSLTARQNAAWEEALATAREAPRHDPVDLDAVPRDTTIALAPNEPVPFAEWPDRLWVFSERPREVVTQWNGSRAVVLMGYPAGDVAMPRLRSMPVSPLPPETPRSRLAGVLGTSQVPPTGRRDPLGSWMEIDFRGLVESGEPGRALGFALRRRPLPQGEYQYSFETANTVRIPEAYLRQGHRGGTGTGVIHPVRRSPR